MDSPLKTRIGATAGLHSSCVRSPKFRIGTETIAMNGEKPVLSVPVPQVEDPYAELCAERLDQGLHREKSPSSSYSTNGLVAPEIGSILLFGNRYAYPESCL
jgi:hypothetical protein